MKVEADSSGTLHRDVSTDWAPEREWVGEWVRFKSVV